jgi:predicted RNase H-like HicB family nuclease
MNQTLLDQAVKLASRNYIYDIRLDQTTAGEPIYFATCPELEGCHAQGLTPEEAFENLILARQDYIYSLLEDNLPVPDPAPISTAVSSGAFDWQEVEFHETERAKLTIFIPVPAS